MDSINSKKLRNFLNSTTFVRNLLGSENMESSLATEIKIVHMEMPTKLDGHIFMQSQKIQVNWLNIENCSSIRH